MTAIRRLVYYILVVLLSAFFFNDPSTTENYTYCHTLSLHDALPILLHDAEDVVRAGELAIFDRLIDRHWVVQLPVLPLPDQQSRLVSGHYQDEIGRAHV